jgi:hypothetical protein
MTARWLLVLLAAPAIAWAQSAVTLHHIHGLAYSGDGKQLMLPSHYGLAVYRNGKWSKAPGPQHDYMGFSATANRLYSSGHPAHGSGLANPFGLIRSQDGGKTWDKLGLEGETDFHLLAAGWNTNAIYVWNPAPSSRMKGPGLHYTLNDGFAWKRADARGLSGEPRALAAHPDDAGTVAVATSSGLYLSTDSGGHFSKVAANGEGLSALFDLDGKSLWYGSFDGRARLTRVPLPAGSRLPISLPELKDDAVAYIAQNPVRRLEYAIATFERSVYLSPDGGKTWKPIADRSRAK